MLFHRSTIIGGACAVGLATAGLLAYDGWILPSRQRNQELAQRVVAMTRDLQQARVTLQQVRDLENEASEARGALDRRVDRFSGDSAQVWLPALVKEHFKRFGIEIEVIRFNAVREAEGMPGYRRAYWGIGVPVPGGTTGISGLLYAVAELEQQNQILKVIDFEVRPNVENDLLLEGVMNVAALIRE